MVVVVVVVVVLNTHLIVSFQFSYAEIRDITMSSHTLCTYSFTLQ